MQKCFTPSQYLANMTLNSDEWLKYQHVTKTAFITKLFDLQQISFQLNTTVPPNQPLFQPVPSEIIFRNFNPFCDISLPLVLRNDDSVPRCVKVSIQDSPYFQIISPPALGKIGPGLSVTYKILFSPQECQDYEHKVVCTTEREEFVVPIKAIGPRAILDFNDVIDFSACPVKYLTSKTIFIRNIGNCTAHFTLSTDCPFTVTPDTGCLEVNASMQVTLGFRPMCVGCHRGLLIIHYHTGEDVNVELCGMSEDQIIRLEKNVVRLDNTFINMLSSKSVTLINRSNIVANYRWTTNVLEITDNLVNNKIINNFNADTVFSSQNNFPMEDKNKDIKIYVNCDILSIETSKNFVNTDNIKFIKNVVEMYPGEGCVWPHSSVDIKVTFAPRSDGHLDTIMYCDVEGRETRLPLYIKGQAQGPSVELSYDSLDMGDVVFHTTNIYEIILANKGLIDADFKIFLDGSSQLKSCFEVEPEAGHLGANIQQIICVRFTANTLGHFSCKFKFEITNQPRDLFVIYKGCVVAPSFQFSVDQLDFGAVSCGFEVTRSFVLTNTSFVPLKFQLRIPSDGTDAAAERADAIRKDFKVCISVLLSHFRQTCLKEFTISPAYGQLDGHSCTTICILFCSNTVKVYEELMVFDVVGVQNDAHSIFIRAQCILPELTLLSPNLFYDRVPINHPATKFIELQNSTEHYARYKVGSLSNKAIDLFSSLPDGIIAPTTCAAVPLTMVLKELKDLHASLDIFTFKSDKPFAKVHVFGKAEGPVVKMSSTCINFGSTCCLSGVSKQLFLCNQSPIPASFRVFLQKNVVFSASPLQDSIPPNDTIIIVITACLDDAINFTDRLMIDVEHGATLTCDLLAQGKGPTLVIDSQLMNGIRIGPQFTKSQFKCSYSVCNAGRRVQSVIWSTLSDKKNKKTVRERAKSLLTCHGPIFIMNPQRMELLPNQKATFDLVASAQTPCSGEETLLCHVIIGKGGLRELAYEVKVTYVFVDPLIKMNVCLIQFAYNMLPGLLLNEECQCFEISNVSSLPLVVNLQLHHPAFSLSHPNLSERHHNMKLNMVEGASQEVEVWFNPLQVAELAVKKLSACFQSSLIITYEGHSNSDDLLVKVVINYPNLSLEHASIDFGCILNDTEASREMTLCNSGDMPVSYKWSFLVGDESICSTRQLIVNNDEVKENMEEYALVDNFDELDTRKYFELGRRYIF
uniref:HYDIN/VesB/CFA65-like Ig-like domain-containing protein n=1 Tax=Helobdella robusta TaxID=6412 RepID=T1FWU7_HELRO